MKHEGRLAGVLVAFVSGALFAVGLAVAGMTQPAKVVGFLDVAGSWDASLAFVMVGAIAVFSTLSRLATKRSTPLWSARFQLPTRRDIELKLVLGSALFGVGWGLSGYCPGPGITSLATGSAQALTFVAAMAAGMLVFEWAQSVGKRKPRPESVQGEQPSPAESFERA
jgi:uncharacterized membrane protein YedE/YeeE